MSPLIVSALLLSTAPRPFEPLAHLAPPVSTDTYGVATVRGSSSPDLLYVVDCCCFRSSPEEPISPHLMRFEFNAAAPQVSAWARPTLVLDGLPQHAWSLSL
jgi:hypothetical protein